MKFDIKSRRSNGTRFTAEIECEPDTSLYVKIGLAVQWGIENNADLRHVNLENADLRYTNLENVNLWSANLRHANLRHANLRHANLRHAELESANLWSANLGHADLESADLESADLRHANMRSANLWSANLWHANLRHAELENANLRHVDLWGTTGNMKHIKTMHIEKYNIAYTADRIQIGCRNHSIGEWKGFSDAQIRLMDGALVLEWWKKWKDWIFQTIEMSPAEPTRQEVAAAGEKADEPQIG